MTEVIVYMPCIQSRLAGFGEFDHLLKLPKFILNFDAGWWTFLSKVKSRVVLDRICKFHATCF